VTRYRVVLAVPGDPAAVDPIRLARQLAEARMAGVTVAELGRRAGRSRSWASNMLALLSLVAEVQGLVRDGRLDVSKARTIARLPPASQLAIARDAVTAGLSLRKVERLAAQERRRLGEAA
jgi:ParB-like chromosome segregation protein Spo0J